MATRTRSGEWCLTPARGEEKNRTWDAVERRVASVSDSEWRVAVASGDSEWRVVVTDAGEPEWRAVPSQVWRLGVAEQWWRLEWFGDSEWRVASRGEWLVVASREC